MEIVLNIQFCSVNNDITRVSIHTRTKSNSSFILFLRSLVGSSSFFIEVLNLYFFSLFLKILYIKLHFISEYSPLYFLFEASC